MSMTFLKNQFSLYLVTDRFLTQNKGLVETVKRAVKGGVTAVQLREKNLSTKDFVLLAKRLKKELRPFKIPLIINDRIDVAIASHADGVHLGQNDLSYLDAKKVLNEDIKIGITVENIEQAKKALSWDVTYLGLSSIFKSNTKKETIPYWTSNRIKELLKLNPPDLIGIGGIDEDNIKETLSWGLSGLAVCSAICKSKDLDEVETNTVKLKNIIRDYYDVR